MANRSFHKPLGCLEIDVVTLWGNFTVGAAGAPTLVATGSKGVASITRNSAGRYTIVFSDQFQQFLFFAQNVMAASDDPTVAGLDWRIISQDMAAAAGATVVVQFQTTAAGGAALDPGNGATVFFRLEARNSSVV